MSATHLRRSLCSAARALAAPALFAVSAPLAAQGGDVGGRSEVFAASELESYLRVLQVAGKGGLYPWSIRGFSPREVERLAPTDSVHPWSARYALQPDTAGGVRADWVRPRVQLLYNSAFPYGMNDGPVWAGRGVTTVAQAGGALRYGPVSLTLAPLVFRAENSPFEMLSNGLQGPRAFAALDWHYQLDVPRRFGDDPYVRIDPGESTLRVDVAGVAVGASTASQVWGPAEEFPLLLGNNAPGFPHVFLGTAAPVNVWLGSGHARLVWGRLDESPYSAAPADSSRRLMSGVVAVFSPRGAEGLEIGVGRFFHAAWTEEGLTPGKILAPLQGVLKADVSRWGDSTYNETSNQLASVFARWVFPPSGLEAYAEYAREDHSWDLRDFLLEPDHTGGYVVGLRKVWEPASGRLTSLRGEVMNTRLSHLTLGRPTQPFYVHGYLRQGHTHRGQLLGAPGGYAGAGAALVLDHYHPGGRWSLEWRRVLRETRAIVPATGKVDPRGEDVLHALRAELLLFRGGLDVTAGLAGVYNLNRDFGSDVFNLNADVGFRLDL